MVLCLFSFQPYEETYPEGAYEGYEYSHYSQPPQA